MVRPLFKFDLSEDILWFYQKMKFLSIFIYIIRVGCSRVSILFFYDMMIFNDYLVLRYLHAEFFLFIIFSVCQAYVALLAFAVVLFSKIGEKLL